MNRIGQTLLNGILLGVAPWAGLAVCFAVLWVCAQFVVVLAVPAAHPHDKLEAVSFIANISLSILATVAGYIAYRQFAEAKNTRVASLYLQITENYKTEAMRESRRSVLTLSHAHAASGTTMAFGEYLAELFDDLRTRPLSDPGFLLYNNCMRLMEFWEEVGVLARRDLVDCEILLDYMADNIRWVDSCFMAFIRRRRREKGPELYSNALWLMDRAGAVNAYRHRDR